MCELLITLAFLYIVGKLHNVKIVRHYYRGIYLYYQVQVFNRAFTEFRPAVKKICLWKLKDPETYDDPY